MLLAEVDLAVRLWVMGMRVALITIVLMGGYAAAQVLAVSAVRVMGHMRDRLVVAAQEVRVA